MNEKKKELASLLDAISIVSKRLADNLPETSNELPMIYVASPLKGDVNGNLRKANEHCRFVVANQAIPYAPHAYYSGFLNDSVTEERAIGMFLGKEMLKRCDELWAFCDSGEPTEGMQQEIELAQELSIPVRYFRKD